MCKAFFMPKIFLVKAGSSLKRDLVNTGENSIYFLPQHLPNTTHKKAGVTRPFRYTKM